jgi:LuxR family transcriptional regulator, maltose regulon positive regulatory protein
VSSDAERSVADPLRTGHEALARGDWQEARTCFEAALATDETPEILEALGLASWWLDDSAATFNAREQAYRLYRDRGDRRGAARIAICLAWDHCFFRGEGAVANGWIERPARLLGGLGPSAEHAMLAICEGDLALFFDNDPARARILGAKAAELGQSLGLIDLEMLARALEGLALVSEGQVGEGMRRLDEATTAAVAGEMTSLEAITWTCCFLIYACERVRDYDRATQWCDTVKRISMRWPYRLMFSLCRAHYGDVLMRRGAWEEAEGELAEATAGLEATRPALAAEAVLRLAELRRRQGRLKEAAELLRKTDSRPLRLVGGKPALLGRAALALDESNAKMAADLAERYLRSVRPEDRLERAAGLELLVRACVEVAQIDPASIAVAELRSIATAIGTEPWLACAGFAEGLVAAAEDYEAARDKFEDTVDLFARNGAPFEAARARVELARTLLHLGRTTDAEREAKAALECFQSLGAALECERTDALLHMLRAPPLPFAIGIEATGLTPREIEMLRLLAAGNSNQEIASMLVLSVRTVERHISSIYERIGARGKVARASATAYAFSRGLAQPHQAD